MRKLLAVALLAPGLLAVQVAVNAANSSAQIVDCSTATACFSPNPIRVTVGSTVSWRNNTSRGHTATSYSAGWDTGGIASGATSSAISFNTAGMFAYHCSFHPDMHGTIIVTSAVTTTPGPTVQASTSALMHRLAQSGGGPVGGTAAGPVLPIGAGLALLGLGALSAGRLRRMFREAGDTQAAPNNE